ncbi:MAG: amidohydrolase family protein [Lachnospiraceae bacterium]|nr:amidohydrolase family protein [Lachnospiraceae bacterium]
MSQIARDPEHEGFVLHGAVVYSESPGKLVAYDDAYVVCVDGVSKGVYTALPEEYSSLPLTDAYDKLIMPGLVDLHIHAPQYQIRGNGMDMELIDWLNAYAFPEESKYSDLSYAERAYDLFVEELYVGPTTRACVFATADPDATLGLMDMLEDTGLRTYVGKVNMDRNVPDYCLEDTEESLEITGSWLDAVRESGYVNTKPIITPRFTPSCSRELMSGLAGLAREYQAPAQSHISENVHEVEWVSLLEPDASCYADTYVKSGIIGEGIKTVMAHCVWSGEKETDIFEKYGVYIAHSPESNVNLCSGAAPIKSYLKRGLHVGLATDVSGGSSPSMFSAMRSAVWVSKLRHRLYNETLSPLTSSEVFYMATRGGGEFFGNVGSFEEGFEFDAIIVDDEQIMTMRDDMTAAERLERVIYLADDRHVVGKYVAGRKLF